MPSLLDLPYKVFTRSGRSALVLALRAAAVRPGDRVLVPTYHCPTMIAPVESLQATPVFYPLTQDGLPDLDRLDALCGAGPKAILVAHLFGLPRRLERVAEFCKTRAISMIEDCAHAFFGSIDGVPVGSTGEFAIGSLPKFFPVIEGGLLASGTRPLDALECQRQPLRAELRAAWDILDVAAGYDRLGVVGSAIRAVTRLTRRADRGTPPLAESPAEPSSETIRAEGLADPLLQPMRLRATEYLVMSHSELTKITCRRNQNYHAIADALDNATGIRPLFPECGPNAAPYVVPLLTQRPDAAYARMRVAGLPVFRWDRLWPGTPLYPHDAAVDWCRGLIQLACHQSLDSTDIERICRLIEQSVKL